MVVTNAERTNLGPLTTTFTAPASCMVAFGACPGCNTAWMGQLCNREGVHDADACWPETTPGVLPNPPAFDGKGFYSPGLICPSAFEPACSATAGGQSNWPVQFIMTAGETAIGCCPLGFQCENVMNGQTCVMTKATPASNTVLCVSGTVITGGAQVTASTATGDPLLRVYAPLVQLVFKESDIASSSTSSSSAQTSIPGAGTTSDLGNNPNNSDSSSQPSAGLGAGVVAGIVVGVIALLLGVAVAAFLVGRKRRRDKDLGSHAGGPAPPPDHQYSSVPKNEAVKVVEVDSLAQRPELGTDYRPELQSAPVPVRQELPGSTATSS
ncbi:hypothetical protein QBC34DRAFT_407216 [Podospora aff. communis PSN243]|uniref:Mid2 domain-containing protein n=1 Tax=Podospora aff. communis PSN243 TaxID=3040156 RepID=A0AAV9GHT8_9PEZI|nr:hypothetical protein QBC34DRAFT_407216 [Podospora aff. communis PSN243]